MTKFFTALIILMTCTSATNATARIFFRPENEGVKLALCQAATAACGKAVADAFCTAQGFSEAILFEREILPEGTTPTFRQIKCYVLDAVALN